MLGDTTGFQADLDDWRAPMGGGGSKGHRTAPRERRCIPLWLAAPSSGRPNSLATGFDICTPFDWMCIRLTTQYGWPSTFLDSIPLLALLCYRMEYGPSEDDYTHLDQEDGTACRIQVRIVSLLLFRRT